MKLLLICDYVMINLQLICNYVTIKLQLICNYATIKLQLICDYVTVKLQLILDRQHTSIIADELIPVTKIQLMIPCTTVDYNTIK